MFIAHGPVRAYVLGERCNDSDKPGGPFKYPVTDEEIREMSEVVREAVAAGALGFSTNRLGGHRDGQGGCVPGTLGSAYEYSQLARGAAMGGGGVAQFVSDFASYDDIPRNQMDPAKQSMRGQQDWDALTFVSAEYGLKCLVSMGLPNDKNGALGSIGHHTKRMRELEAAGGAITIQTFARPQALLTSFDCRSNYFAQCATYKGMKESMSNSELKASLQSPDVRSIILAEMDEIIARNTRLSVVVKSQWNQNNLKWHFPMGDDFDYEPGPEKSVTAIAEATGKSVYEVLYDTMCTHEGNGMTWRPLESYGGGDLETMRLWLETDGVVPGISDAGAHLSIFQVCLCVSASLRLCVCATRSPPAYAPARLSHRSLSVSPSPSSRMVLPRLFCSPIGRETACVGRRWPWRR